MNLFRSPVKVFEEENDENFLKINSEDIREEVQKMVDYISTSSISVYQVQIIRKDLIAMALEAELDHISLEEKLGREPMDFCDDVIGSVGESSVMEMVLGSLYNILNGWALYYTCGFFLVWGMPKEWGITLGDIFVVFGAAGLCDIGIKKIHHKMFFWKKVLRYGIVFALSILVAVGFYLIRETETGNIFVIRGDGWGILFVLAALAAGMGIVWNKYWERMMGK